MSERDGADWGWQPWRPIERQRSGSSPEELAISAQLNEARKVIGFCAVCDVRSPFPDGDACRFSVSVFAVLAGGDHVLLDERGWTTSTVRGTRGARRSFTMTPTELLARMENVLIPDDDENEDDRDWDELAFLCRARGLETTSDDLRDLPYRKLLTDRSIEGLESVKPD